MSDVDGRLRVLVHEVRSPVAALFAVAEAARETDAPARRELVRLALDACAAIERIVTDAALTSIRPALVDLGALARDAARARSVAGEAVTSEGESAPLLVEGDPVRLRQALDNLLANAVVHAGSSGHVVVRLRRSATRAEVSVTDAGPGIAADDLERIFEAGVRLDERRPGSGIGLALARALVEAHGGTLTAASTVGEGSTFTISLPAARPQPAT